MRTWYFTTREQAHEQQQEQTIFFPIFAQGLLEITFSTFHLSLLKDDAHAPLPAGSSDEVSILGVESLLPFSAWLSPGLAAEVYISNFGVNNIS